MVIVCRYIFDFKRSFLWLATLKKSIDISSLFLIFGNIAKNLKKQIKREDCNKTMKQLVSDRELPKDGLISLVRQLRSEEAWITTFIQQFQSSPVLDKICYEKFLRILFASIYVFAPQGRVGGIADLKLQQGVELVETGQTMTTSFKTRYYFGYQPIVLADMAFDLMKYYIRVVRPRIAPEDNSGCSPLWLSIHCQKLTAGDISGKVVRYVGIYCRNINNILR